MVGSTSVGFSELVMAGERIVIGLKLGELQMGNTSNALGGAGKKPFSGYPKKKVEPSTVYGHNSGRGMCRQHDQPQVNVVTIPLLMPSLRLLRSKTRCAVNISKGGLGRLLTQFLCLIMRIYIICCS